MNAANKTISTKKLVLTALFIGLSVVGANIKVMGSIAFDALPAFLAALMLGPLWRAAVGAPGPLLPAPQPGLPLTFPAPRCACTAL